MGAAAALRLAPFRESPPQLQEGRKAVLTVHCGPEVFLDLGRHFCFSNVRILRRNTGGLRNRAALYPERGKRHARQKGKEASDHTFARRARFHVPMAVFGGDDDDGD